MAAKVLGMRLHGVVPASAPRSKKQGAQELWGDEPGFQLHVEGNTFDESLGYAKRHPQLGELVHPFDDEVVAAGQGTILDDIIDAAVAQGVMIKHIVVALGGGGLAAGIARRADERGLSVIIHGVEAEGSDSLSQSVKARRIIAATKPNLRYGGSAVKHSGQHTLETYQALPNMRLWQTTDSEVRALVDDYEQEIHYRELDKFSSFVPLEPTSLVAIAGLAQIARAYPGEGIAVIGTGRNDSLDKVWN
jgi:threonine dehydratase